MQAAVEVEVEEAVNADGVLATLAVRARIERRTSQRIFAQSWTHGSPSPLEDVAAQLCA